ncbi:MAG: serine/threonine protein kinase [Phycisphaerales bacterium]|jgi:serine/threonine protein kinase
MKHTSSKPSHLQSGCVLAGKYTVQQFLGSGYEGEVYRVVEDRTGSLRAAKLFFSERNVNDAAVRFYARKLERLRRCSILTQYHHSETIRYRGERITLLISELVEGVLLSRLVDSRPGKRIPEFEAMVLLHSLASGLGEIHDQGEYHGDLHSGNVLIRPVGITFECKLIDFQNLGRPTKQMIATDVIDLVRLFYDALGGSKRYASFSGTAKHICAGLRRGLITERFPTASHLAEHLETFE